jgi:hypothetical protein
MSDAPSTAVSYPLVVLPGELVSTILSQPLKLGPGLLLTASPTGETLIQATQAGLLHRAKQSELYIDYNSHRVFLPPFLLVLTCVSTFQAKASPSSAKSSLEQPIIIKSIFLPHMRRLLQIYPLKQPPNRTVLNSM